MILNLQNIYKDYQQEKLVVPVLKDVSLTVEEGEYVAIMGPSGSGKTTLMNIIGCLDRPTSGTYELAGENVLKLKDRELSDLRLKSIGFVFQSFQLMPRESAVENVALPLSYAGVRKKERRSRATKALERVGLGDRVNFRPTQLSGGQKQRVAIARVLAADPEILLCDEATSALDPQTTKAILSLLKEINEKMGITIVVITHEMAVVQAICNRVGVLEKGVLVEQGDVEQLFRNPQTSAARNLIYNGTAYKESITAGRKVRITFEGNSSFEPILGNIILECKTPVNILYANTQNVHGKAVGQMILQLPEEKELADRFVEYFHQKNLGVEEVEEDA